MAKYLLTIKKLKKIFSRKRKLLKNQNDENELSKYETHVQCTFELWFGVNAFCVVLLHTTTRI